MSWQFYDVESLQLRYRISEVFAHSLACSPDGRTLVTGSSHGAIKIFEFGGDRRHQPALIYRINTYEEGIRDIAFSRDGLRFADIKGSQYRIWEPVVLMRSDDDELSQSEFSQTIPLDPKSVDVSEGGLAAEITAMFPHPNAELVFCGKQDGSMVGIEICYATQIQPLYRHATNASVTVIAYNESRSIVISADDSSRVLIYKVVVTNSNCKTDAHIADIRAEDSIVSILPNVSGSRLLIQCSNSAELWTMEGAKGHAIPMEVSRGEGQTRSERMFVNLPSDPDFCLCVDSSCLLIHSWEGKATNTYIAEISGKPPLSTNPSPQIQNVIVKLQKTTIASKSTSATLQAWKSAGKADSPQLTPMLPI